MTALLRRVFGSSTITTEPIQKTYSYLNGWRDGQTYEYVPCRNSWQRAILYSSHGSSFHFLPGRQRHGCFSPPLGSPSAQGLKPPNPLVEERAYNLYTLRCTIFTTLEIYKFTEFLISAFVLFMEYHENKRMQNCWIINHLSKSAWMLSVKKLASIMWWTVFYNIVYGTPRTQQLQVLKQNGCTKWVYSLMTKDDTYS